MKKPEIRIYLKPGQDADLIAAAAGARNTSEWAKSLLRQALSEDGQGLRRIEQRLERIEQRLAAGAISTTPADEPADEQAWDPDLLANLKALGG